MTDPLSDTIGEALVEGLLPEWAAAFSTGKYMEVGACLPTRDGRRIGNATVLAVEGFADAPLGQTAITITDAGNVCRFTERELRDWFWPPMFVARMPRVWGRATIGVDLTLHREQMIEAVLARHRESSLACFPNPNTVETTEVRAWVETYRPYAAADVDAIIAALKPEAV